MNKRLKFILSIIILLVIVISVVFLFRKNNLSSYISDMTNGGSSSTFVFDLNINDLMGTALIPDNSENPDSSIQNAPPPDDDSANSDIDTYLKAYRTSEQPDPDDFDDPYSDLK